ncbi:Mini-ribonuclease 3 [Tissierella praeacuta]|uniref:Mini-ribonuclease 3 n=1 Tax=Tissierella praeacuta DSM 18095 TaxID=1123404 RepID=A0A1M4Y0J5_9FIRM|nr:ribonuclease III domain-containing protein [Tissierella praeacuta]HAE92346.1 Mini-ribonuclease 3 [Tissierella sp.]MBU5256370.1 Mini-ribonuclease 3 [Tissierella praeacuta]TCU69731.1 ribonuclease-3 family protein [Tissierella praeacuta]SHE99208.1 ribonuclease-3 family protein [Tissierella praeacuta DSM 18095]SUP03343.1 Mini-ribonuclease 3 [Tissierella praeacuta]
MGENNLFRKMNTELNAEDITMLSPLQLAYIGDAVYELFVRTYLLEKKLSVKELHKSTIKYVRAEAQANIVHILDDVLTEEEQIIVKKGRNAKTNTMPKNANMIDYKYATGFEALIGYLYLMGKDSRIEELFELVSNIEINK